MALCFGAEPSVEVDPAFHAGEEIQDEPEGKQQQKCQNCGDTGTLELYFAIAMPAMVSPALCDGVDVH